MKTFLLKFKHFFRRNIYPITVGLCTVLVLGIIGISAYGAIKSENAAIQTNNIVEPAKEVPVEGDKVNDDSNNKDEHEPNKDDEETNVTNSPSVIIFDLPFNGAEITKEYADDKLLYDKTTKLWCTHQGIDFACSAGTKVKAVYDGVVTKVESSMMNGTVIYLDIGDGVIVVYKGLSADVKVQEGDKVKKGQELGEIQGFLAEQADGVHLHLEMFKNDKIIDPTDYFSFNK
ncbi:MAG: M23 family metallopeptidase [Clostridia bacterium]|nr:M23 family metallopeptidase [Clostridia bacterium]